MSNIYSLRDQENQRFQRNQQQQSGIPNIPFLVTQQDDGGDPRNESFFKFLKFACCPTFHVISFIFIISIFGIAMFILSLSISTKIRGEFLQPDLQALILLGAKNPYQLKRGHLWLLITPSFLHANFMHILINLLSQMIFGLTLESSIGKLKIGIIYIVSGMGGILLSCLISDSTSVGASSCIFGLLGAQLGYLILNWKNLETYGQLRCQLLIMIIIIVLVNLFIGLGNSVIDNYGHLGGFIMGMLLGIILMNPIQTTAEEKGKQRMCMYIFAALFAIMLICFYAFRNPVEI